MVNNRVFKAVRRRAEPRVKCRTTLQLAKEEVPHIIHNVSSTIHSMRTCTQVLAYCTQGKKLASVKFMYTSCSLGSQLRWRVCYSVLRSARSSTLLRMPCVC